MSFTPSASGEQKTINIASIDWCPQICPDGKEAGYIVDIVTEIFRSSPYNPTIEVYPWSRAIQMTRTGKVHALLSPAKAEAPDLVYPMQEIGTQRMCFFVLRDNAWNFEGVDSLEGHLTAIASDTSIEELNDFIATRDDLFYYAPYGTDYLPNSLDMLHLGRVNSFLFTYNSTIHAAQKRGFSDQIRPAGCVSVAKIYMAFSPANGHASDIREMVAYFDEAMARFRADDRIAGIMQAYGLPDWSSEQSSEDELRLP